MALKLLRDNLKHLKFILWGVVLVFILLVFVDWGSGRAGRRQNGVAVTVGKHQVTEQEFLKQVKSLQENYKRQLGDNWDRFKDRINLGQQAAQQIIQRQLMLDVAAEAGISVAPEEIRKEILSFPVFTDESGNFVGEEMYRKVLRSNRSTPAEFEEQLREDLTLRKLQNFMRDTVYVSNAEADESMRKKQESVDLRAAQLRYERYLADVVLDEKEVRDYFEANRDSFSRPEERVIRYLVIETNKLRRLLKVDDARIESYYKEHTEDFRQEEQARASHILFKVDPGADTATVAEIKLKAEQVLKIARAGGDFSELAKKYSEDPGSQQQGGDLGWFGRNRMVKEFEKAVFEAKPGDIIGPVKSQFGFHIIKVTGHREGHVRPLDEVRDDVRFQVLKTLAADEAKKRAEVLAAKVREEKPDTDEAWQAIADEDEAVSLNESPAFAAEDTIPGTGTDKALSKEVFEAAEGQIGGPRAIPRGWMVWQLKEIDPAGVPPFEKARAEAEQKLRQMKALDIAAQKAKEMADALRAGGNFDELAKAENTEVVTVKAHRRGTAFSSLGVIPALDKAVFAATAGSVPDPVVLPNRGAIVAVVDAVKKLDAGALEAGRAAEIQSLRAEKANELLSSILSEKRRNTTVLVNNEIVDRFAPDQNQS